MTTNPLKRGAPRTGRTWWIGRVDLGDAPGRANGGDKLLTLAVSALAGGPPAAASTMPTRRAGGTEQALGFAVQAPSALGTFLRSPRWGHARHLDRVSRQALAWAAGADSGDGPLTIDPDFRRL